MLYLESDFDGCVFNPMRKVGIEIDVVYPELREREGYLVGSFGVGLVKDKVVRWVMGMYQPESPLLRDYPDYKARRYQAGLMVGFDIGVDGLFIREYLDVVMGLNGRVNRFVVDFCRILRDDDYSELRVYQDKLYVLLGMLAGGSEVKDDKVILGNITDLKGRIEFLKKKYLVQDEDGRLLEEMRSVMDNDYVDMSRESLVRRMEKGEDLYGDRYVPPYGKEYVKKYYQDVNRERYMGTFRKSV